MPIDLVPGLTATKCQRCFAFRFIGKSVAKFFCGNCLLGAPPQAELHLSLRTIGIQLRSTGMCCQTRSSTITSPRIGNNCLTNLVCKQRDNGYFEFSKNGLEFLALHGLSGCQTSNHLTILISSWTEKVNLCLHLHSGTSSMILMTLKM
ncbi:hypothetical protein T12_963 [Trichinella patagoniensis]|uniref:Uncharacterized protein n=1 Tax=Trichinella patagoniensis TaxID=990121 RepID=A0A0V0ZTB6_9BILA|nr:hypothetical protein T12_963 [Trichinella patagoniensis]